MTHWVYAETSPAADPLSDQEGLFRSSNPEDAAHYVVLAPASIEFMKVLREENYHFTKGLINGIRARQDDQEALDTFLDRMERINERGREEEEYGSDLSARLQPGDRLFFFRFRKDEYRDSGLLVIRNGEIVYRKASATAHAPGAELPDKDEVDIDRL